MHYDADLNRQRCVLQICCQGQTSRRCENTDPSENLVGDVTPVVPSIENESTEECLTDLLRSEQNEAVVHQPLRQLFFEANDNMNTAKLSCMTTIL